MQPQVNNIANMLSGAENLTGQQLVALQNSLKDMAISVMPFQTLALKRLQPSQHSCKIIQTLCTVFTPRT